MKKTLAQAFERGIPKTYKELCEVLLPRPIHDDVGLANAIQVTDFLAGRHLNSDQEDYFAALSLFIQEYENQLLEEPSATPLEALRHLIEENGVSTRELGRILGTTESMGFLILSGQRSITPEHARHLAKHFAVNPELFFRL